MPLPRNHKHRPLPPSSFRAQLSFAIEPHLQIRILDLAREKKIPPKRLVLDALSQLYPQLSISETDLRD
jgi:hypothetical protein